MKELYIVAFNCEGHGTVEVIASDTPDEIWETFEDDHGYRPDEVILLSNELPKGYSVRSE